MNKSKNHKNDIDEIERFYLLAIKQDDVDALYNLGNHYSKIKNYQKMKKYYLLFVLMHEYYETKLKDVNNNDDNFCNEMLKYYIMSIENHNIHALTRNNNII
jgi:hypothetical protein